MKRPQLANTFRVIAKDGAKALYDGELTSALLSDITANGGIITAQDLKDYKWVLIDSVFVLISWFFSSTSRPVWGKAVTADLPNGAKLYTTPAPSSGPILAFILNILSGYNALDYSALSFHRIVESFKFAYAKRSDIGDPEFVEIAALLSNLSDVGYANDIRGLINDNLTFTDPKHYGANYTLPDDHGTAHVSIVAPNGDAVAITGTINYM